MSGMPRGLLAAVDHTVIAAAIETNDGGESAAPVVSNQTATDNRATLSHTRHVGAAGRDAQVNRLFAARAGITDTDVEDDRRRAGLAAGLRGTRCGQAGLGESACFAGLWRDHQGGRKYGQTKDYSCKTH